MNKPPVAFICPSRSWGGLEMNVSKLSLWLSKRGHKIILYCYPESDLHHQAIKDGIETRMLASTSKRGDLFLSIRLAKSLKKENIKTAVFHLNKNFPLMVLAKIFSRAVFKLIYMQHMHLGGNKKNLYHNFLYSYLDIWVAPLEMFKKQLLKTTNIAISKIKTIPFGIEIDKFASNSISKTDARKKLNLPLGKNIVGFIGRIDPLKSQHVLIEAAHILNRMSLEIDILFIGNKSKHEEFAYDTKLDDLIVKYNLSGRVHFINHLDDIAIAYQAIDIFCLTTGSETFGMVTVEAMASALPVIGTDAGGTKEIISHNHNGLLYQSENAQEAAEMIKMLLTDKILRDKISTQAKIDAVENYSHQKQCQSLEQLF